MAKPTMIPLNPPERSRTYVYKSGHRHTIENVVAVCFENGWDRLQTADGRLHIVLLVVTASSGTVDWCVAKELDCDSWTL